MFNKTTCLVPKESKQHICVILCLGKNARTRMQLCLSRLSGEWAKLLYSLTRYHILHILSHIFLQRRLFELWPCAPPEVRNLFRQELCDLCHYEFRVFHDAEMTWKCVKDKSCIGHLAFHHQHSVCWGKGIPNSCHQQSGVAYLIQEVPSGVSIQILKSTQERLHAFGIWANSTQILLPCFEHIIFAIKLLQRFAAKENCHHLKEDADEGFREPANHFQDVFMPSGQEPLNHAADDTAHVWQSEDRLKCRLQRVTVGSVQKDHCSHFFRIEESELQTNLDSHTVSDQQGCRLVAHNFFQNNRSVFCMISHVHGPGAFGIVRLKKATVVPANQDRARAPKLSNGSRCTAPGWHPFLTQGVAK